MVTVQTTLWRPEINALTTPQSWRPRYVPRATNGSDSLAARIAQKHPSLDEETVKMTITALIEEIKTDLINGNQSTLDDIITFRLSLNARLDAPDAPLPPVDEVVKVRASFSRAFMDEVRKSVRLERLPMSEKLPVITSSEDTVLGLSDVLNSGGALHFTGSDLAFTQGATDEGCVLEGTRSGRTVQSRFVSVSDTGITLLPDIPAQPDPWNNEYTLSMSTRYTEHGTLRTSIYRRRLRTPLAVELGTDTGILTDKSNSPHITVNSGSLSAEETVRIQAILDMHEGSLAFNLLDMKEGGKAGPAVTVTGNGPLTLTGFSGSALSSLDMTVNSFAKLVQMIRNNYSGRLVDVLEVKVLA